MIEEERSMELTPIQKKREAVVLTHMQAENAKQAAQTVQTFHHPRYEVIPTGEVFEGSEQVAFFLEESMNAFPDFTFKTPILHHAAETVIVEATFHGTHLGNWRGLPATHRQVSYQMCNIFIFDQDRLICERLYFDLLTVLRQLGLASDPARLSGRISMLMSHPFTFLQAGLRKIPPLLRRK